MWYFNSQTIKTPREIVIDDISHPKAIFRSRDVLKSLGIKPYKLVVPDSRYYHNGVYTLDADGDEVVGTYAGTAKDIDALKASMLDTIDSQVALKQGAIDWYWARASKGGKAVPEVIATYAQTIYSEQATKEDEVRALSTLEEIMAYESRPHIETRKVVIEDEDDKESYGNETTTQARNINMLHHWTAHPIDEVDLGFVSLVIDNLKINIDDMDP